LKTKKKERYKMIVYQGDIAKLKHLKTHQVGWFQKLRCKDDTVRFVSIDDPRIKVMPSRVYGNTNNQSIYDKEYSVITTIRGGDVIRFYSSDVGEEQLNIFAKDNQRYDIKKRLKVLQAETKDLDDRLERYNCLLKDKSDKEQEIVALSEILAQIEMSLPPCQKLFRYAWGKHNANDAREYCWEIPEDMTVVPGDVVIVSYCSTYDNRAFVTRIEETIEYRNHKSVKRVVGK
jgi:hypothetical protein